MVIYIEFSDYSIIDATSFSVSAVEYEFLSQVIIRIVLVLGHGFSECSREIFFWKFNRRKKIVFFL